MKKLLNTKNKISNGLTTAQTILGTQTKATTAVDSVVTKISQAKTALELGLVALPSAVLGVGIPVGAITGFSSILEMLGGMIDKNKGLAEQGLSSLKFISYQLSVVQTKLNSHYQAGELDHLKNEKGSLVFQNYTFTFVAGRKLYDFSECSDIIAKEAELKELKNTARSIGVAKEKDGAPSWRVVAAKDN